jgi:enoyl-CoA hydratase
MSVELTMREDCAVLTLNRPEALNALSFDILRRIGEAFEEVARSKARALIITGAGPKAFCAGADIKELRNRDLMAQKRGAELGQAVFAKLDTLPMPSVAVINGYAFGGGLELALACTFRLATRNAKMGLPEIKLGLVPGYGGTQRLPRIVGLGRAKELILTGLIIDADECYRIGLLNRVVEDAALIAEATKLAETICKKGPLAIRAAKQALNQSARVGVDTGLAFESVTQAMLFESEDKMQRMTAFLEKKK